MLLILCPLDDVDTLTFARRATADGVRCRVLTAEALSLARRRSHRIGRLDGEPTGVSVRTEIEALGLPPVRDELLSGVLNRLVGPPDMAWQWAAAAERDYAAAELFAFTLSWLSGLPCPVRNRPTPGCLAGPAPHPLTALTMAVAAGLACPQLRYTTAGDGLPGDLGAGAAAAAGPGYRAAQLVCLDGAVIAGSAPPAVVSAVGEFVTAIGVDADLVGVDFAVRGTHWVFAGLTPLPSLAALDRPARFAVLEVVGAGRVAVA